ncbi:MAG: hypothetical protein ACTHOJ_04900 [Sphingomonas oligoaromativorans]
MGSEALGSILAFRLPANLRGVALVEKGPFRYAPGQVREIEILRIAGQLGSTNHQSAMRDAIDSVLRWAQKRRGPRLPNEAWRGQSFEYLTGGRTCVVVRLEREGSDIWALRADDPDKSVPGRTWTTEVVLGAVPDQAPKLSARLFATTSESQLDIDVAVPGFIRQIISGTGLNTGYQCHDFAWWLNGRDEVSELLDRLTSDARAIPLIVITTGTAGYNADLLPFDPDELAAAMAGLAHVAVLPEELTWEMSRALGRPLSVFGGGVRVYQPGFSSDDDPYGPHDLIMGRQLEEDGGAFRAVRWLKQKLAHGSVRRVRLGSSVISYSDVRDAAIVQKQTALEATGASSEEKLAAASLRIASLEDQRKSDAEWITELENDNIELKTKADTYEAQANAARLRIQQLEQVLRQKGQATSITEPMPQAWGEIADWCDRNFPGRLVLTSHARREVKSPDFEDIELTGRTLSWLADEYRTARMEGGDAALPDYHLEPGVRNCPCGGDTYETTWKSKKRNVDWHVKNGGSTRDPTRCFRVYYFWDDHGKQVVVDHLPGHQTTGAS